MRTSWYMAAWGVILLMLFVSIPPATSSGQPTTGAGSDHHPLRFFNLGNRDGLSQMTVAGIVQDELGFLWFGTEEALDRWDGIRFESFRHDPNDPGSLPPGSIETLISSRTGHVWLGTHSGYLARLDPRSFRFRDFVRHPGSAPSPDDRILCLVEGADGQIWVGTRSGLVRVDPETGTWHDGPGEGFSALHGERIRALALAPTGELWIAGERGLEVFDPITETLTPWRLFDGRDATLHQVRSLHIDGEGPVWLGTWGAGLFRYEPDSGQLDAFPFGDDPYDNQIRALYRDRRGIVWLGTQGRGLVRFHPAEIDSESGAFIQYRRELDDPHSLAGDTVRTFFEDRNGDLWAGTWGFGVSRFDPTAPTFEHVDHDPENLDSLPHSSVRSLLLDRRGTLWVGTHGGGLAERPASQSTFESWKVDPSSSAGITSNTVYALLEDSLEGSQGQIWVGTSRGIDVLDGENHRVVRRHRHRPDDPGSLGGEIIRALYQDREGAIWIGTRNAGLDRFDPGQGLFVHHRHDPGDPQSLPGDRIFALLEDPEGQLWVGTSHGLAKRIGDSGDSPARFTLYANVPGDPGSLRSNVVLALFVDSRSTLWVGTQGGGLSAFDASRQRFTHFTQAEGLANDVVYAIAEDALGRLWVSTNRGLSRFDPTSDSFANYDPADALPVYEFNTGAVVRHGDGRLSFGGVLGLVTFEPEQFLDNPHPPPVVLTAFDIFQKPAELGTSPPFLERAELAWNRNFFSFEFAALDYRRPDKNRYAYQLVGLDEQWIEAGHRRFASYTAVPPGDYVFRVKASNNDGVWNEEGKSLAITIERPLWTRWWAYLFYCVGFFGALGAFVLVQRRKVRHERRINRRFERLLEERTRDLREREQLLGELERFTHTVSHDLRNPLFTIKTYLGRALVAVEQGEAGRAEADLSRVDQAADQLDRLLEELIHFSEVGRSVPSPEPVDLGRLLDTVGERFAERFDRADGVLELEPDLPVVQGDPALLQVVFRSLLDNGLSFCGEWPPRIEVRWRDALPPWVGRNGDENSEPTPEPPLSNDGDPPWVELAVRDQGIGIPNAYHERVFELFERLSPESSSVRTPGTGVGLALVRRIIEAHGGRIWVESEGVGQGSTFRFLLQKASA